MFLWGGCCLAQCVHPTAESCLHMRPVPSLVYITPHGLPQHSALTTGMMMMFWTAAGKLMCGPFARLVALCTALSAAVRSLSYGRVLLLALVCWSLYRDVPQLLREYLCCMLRSGSRDRKRRVSKNRSNDKRRARLLAAIRNLLWDAGCESSHNAELRSYMLSRFA